MSTLGPSPGKLRRQTRRWCRQGAVSHAQYRWVAANVTRFVGRAQVRRLREALARDDDLHVTYDVRRRTAGLWRPTVIRVGQAADEGGA